MKTRISLTTESYSLLAEVVYWNIGYTFNLQFFWLTLLRYTVMWTIAQETITGPSPTENKMIKPSYTPQT